MSAGYMIGSIIYDARVPGGLGDTQIRHANLEATEAHGYADPYQFVGRYLSEIQLEASNERARSQWYQRKRNMPVQTAYPAVVIAEDGELIGHKRTLEWMAGIRGQETYMVRIERVYELPHQVTSAEGQVGQTQDFERVCGRYTVAKLRALYRDGTLALHCGEILATIIAKCSDIAKHFFQDDHEDGVSLAFNRSRCNWSSSDPTATIQLATTCVHCGWQWWWRRAEHADTLRCPVRAHCHRRMGVAEALGAVTRQNSARAQFRGAAFPAVEGSP